MEVRDWVTLASAIIIVIGWFVNSWLNRRHEIAKKKLEHRLTALQSFMPFASSLAFASTEVGKDPVKNDPNFIDKLWTAYTNIQLYGTEHEIELMNEMYGAFVKKDSEKAMKAYPKLYECLRSNLRKELNITY